VGWLLSQTMGVSHRNIGCYRMLPSRHPSRDSSRVRIGCCRGPMSRLLSRDGSRSAVWALLAAGARQQPMRQTGCCRDCCRGCCRGWCRKYAAAVAPPHWLLSHLGWCRRARPCDSGQCCGCCRRTPSGDGGLSAHMAGFSLLQPQNLRQPPRQRPQQWLLSQGRAVRQQRGSGQIRRLRKRA
jgi:hypothetical protein